MEEILTTSNTVINISCQNEMVPRKFGKGTDQCKLTGIFHSHHSETAPSRSAKVAKKVIASIHVWITCRRLDSYIIPKQYVNK